MRLYVRNGRMTRLGVVSPIPADAADGLIGWNLAEQFRQHGRVAHAVVCDLNGAHFQAVRIYGQMNLAPLTSVLRPRWPPQTAPRLAGQTAPGRTLGL